MILFVPFVGICYDGGEIETDGGAIDRVLVC